MQTDQIARLALEDRLALRSLNLANEDIVTELMQELYPAPVIRVEGILPTSFKGAGMAPLNN